MIVIWRIHQTQAVEASHTHTRNETQATIRTSAAAALHTHVLSDYVVYADINCDTTINWHERHVDVVTWATVIEVRATHMSEYICR